MKSAVILATLCVGFTYSLEAVVADSIQSTSTMGIRQFEKDKTRKKKTGRKTKKSGKNKGEKSDNDDGSDGKDKKRKREKSKDKTKKRETSGYEDSSESEIPIEPSDEFIYRRDTFLQQCAKADGLYATACRVAMWESVYDEAAIEDALDFIHRREDTADFRMNTLVRILYLNNERGKVPLPAALEQKMEDEVLAFKYWFTEPGEDAMIMWTENHQILFHTSELLAGQLYRERTFSNSGMTGSEHMAHALSFLHEWLDKRGALGFSEWHSNIYYVEDLAPLVNLVDYAEDPAIVTKAAMLIDIIAFDLANNYFKGLYATTMGRTNDSKRVTTDEPSESITMSAWILLGLEELQIDGVDMASSALATSKQYIAPTILQNIAVSAREYNVHRERSSIDVDQGGVYGLSYNATDSLANIMYWWAMSAQIAAPLISSAKGLIEKYDLDQKLVYGDDSYLNQMLLLANQSGMSLTQYSDAVEYITRGVCLESINTYTYRTPYYQLSGAQDHQKGWTGLQEQIWQATLDKSTYVFTSSPGGISESEFVGGWKPRAMFHENVGIIQYDRDPGDPILDYLISSQFGARNYVHAYFPRSAFDEVIQSGGWTFGSKAGGYVALYSDKNATWESDYEMRVSDTTKNLFIVELGSMPNSFTQFQEAILAAKVEAMPQDRGYNVYYDSPSVGSINVTWDSPMIVNGKNVNLGPYPRFDNSFCHQKFGSLETIIEHEDLRLVLNFETLSRKLYQITT